MKTDEIIEDSMSLIGKMAKFKIDQNGRNVSIQMEIKGVISDNGTMRIVGIDPGDPKHRISMLRKNVEILD